ncbi:hypothetical protein CUMW_193410 [Citrus unshiu]|uniref:Uncharacterized protein n=1 Tax=Citrus unshiu TaxID=55188 RepID=A0A2H5Q3Z1_CITUN|nr:hypothetical protein CUMW_193410 [Citrus unshiu]
MPAHQPPQLDLFLCCLIKLDLIHNNGPSCIRACGAAQVQEQGSRVAKPRGGEPSAVVRRAGPDRKEV